MSFERRLSFLPQTRGDVEREAHKNSVTVAEFYIFVLVDLAQINGQYR